MCKNYLQYFLFKSGILVFLALIPSGDYAGCEEARKGRRSWQKAWSKYLKGSRVWTALSRTIENLPFTCTPSHSLGSGGRNNFPFFLYVTTQLAPKSFEYGTNNFSESIYKLRRCVLVSISAFTFTFTNEVFVLVMSLVFIEFYSTVFTWWNEGGGIILVQSSGNLAYKSCLCLYLFFLSISPSSFEILIYILAIYPSLPLPSGISGSNRVIVCVHVCSQILSPHRLPLPRLITHEWNRGEWDFFLYLSHTLYQQQLEDSEYKVWAECQ